MNTVALPTRLQWLHVLGDYIGPLALCAFGIMLLITGASENLATFASWGTLDLFIGVSLIRSGNVKTSILPFAYGIIAMFVVLMIHRNGHWQLGGVEYVCASGTLVAVGCWIWRGAWLGTVVGAVTMWIAGIPAIIDMWHSPQPSEWFLWFGAGVSAAIGLYLNWPLRLSNIDSWAFVMSSFSFSCVMVVLIYL